MQTPYCLANQAFSDAAHVAAQDQIYPYVFDKQKSELTFQSTSLELGEKERILDGEMGIDRIVKVECGDLKNPLSFTIQERFRKVSFRKYQDITITAWNQKTNLPSELYKINSGFFVYGYYDPESNEIVEWIIVTTELMRMAIANERLNYDWGVNPRSNQKFMTIGFNDLYHCKAMFSCYLNGQKWHSVKT